MSSCSDVYCSTYLTKYATLKYKNYFRVAPFYLLDPVDLVGLVGLEVLWDGKSYLQVEADRALFSFSAARLRNLILIGLSSFVNQC